MSSVCVLRISKVKILLNNPYIIINKAKKTRGEIQSGTQSSALDCLLISNRLNGLINSIEDFLWSLIKARFFTVRHKNVCHYER